MAASAKQPEETEGTSPDLATGVSGFVYCPTCAARNGVERKYCSVCWSPLTEPIRTLEEAEALRRRLTRRRRIRRGTQWTSWLIGLAIVAWAVQLVVIDRSVPTPDGRALLWEGPGQWSIAGGNLFHEAFREESPRFSGEVLWSVGTADKLLASPIVAAGVVYQATGDNRLLALDLETGTQIWAYRTNGPVNSTPAVSEEGVYLGLRDGRVIALDRESGAELWTYRTGNHVFAPLTYSSGTLYAGTGDGLLHALDLRTGRRLWSFPTGNAVTGIPVIRGNVLAAVSGNGVVTFVDWTTAKRRLNYVSRQIVGGNPAFHGDVLLVPTDRGGLLALDSAKLSYPLEGFARRWRNQIFLWGLQQSPPVPKGYLWELPLAPGSTVSSPAVAEGIAYVVTGRGVLHAVDIAEGSARWRYDAEEPTIASPVVAGAFVYFGTDAGHIHVVDRMTGDRVDLLSVGERIIGQPAVAGNVLLVAGEGGTLFALR